MKVLWFVGSIIESIKIDQNSGSRVGLMIAGERAEVAFHMNAYWNKDGLLQGLNVASKMQKSCDPSLALK